MHRKARSQQINACNLKIENPTLCQKCLKLKWVCKLDWEAGGVDQNAEEGGHVKF